jgi:hypothetical protein
VLRREFLALPCAFAVPAAPLTSFPDYAEQLFLTIVRGYLTNTSKTSKSLAVVEYPDATVTKNFLAKSGLSATGVTRMLPAIAAWIAGGRRPGIVELNGETFDLLDVVGSAIVNGTDPENPDYWLPSPADTQNQRQVEASIVAWTVYLLRDALLPQMASSERQRIDEWLRSCTQREVRGNNWAWFTAINHAARMALKDKFDEFSFDQRSMFEDLTALDAMHTGQGWYNDAKPGQAYDYYNSWVFASHFLYWNAMVGSRFPEWSERFGDRLKQYLQTAPLFFGANGAHILYGRSLIYRWGVLTPLVLAYAQNLWPHSPGLLQRIVWSNLDYHERLDAIAPGDGKLRETFSSAGTRDIRETYIDGGHPYWGMQAFAMFLTPRSDAFWTGSGEPLPVEQADFSRPLEAPGLVLVGRKDSGHVKLLQGRSSKTDLHYRDKYNKFSYSSHFPFCIVQRPDVCPWDNAIVLRDRRRRRSAGRGELLESRLIPGGIEIAYAITYGGLKVSVRTTVLSDGEFEGRLHRVIAPADVDREMELAEGASALGVDNLDDGEHNATDLQCATRNRKTGLYVASWKGQGWVGIGAAWDFGTEETAASNIVHPRFYVNTLWAALKPGSQVLSSVHYASPRPLAVPLLNQGSQSIFARLRSGGAGPVSAVKPRSSSGERQTAPAKARP